MASNARPARREVLHRDSYQRRMQRLSAQETTRRSPRGHIYWSPPLRQWLLSYSEGKNVVIEFYADCPCGA